MNKNRVALIILDGWGLNKEYPGNAITLANTPTWDHLWNDYSSAVLQASGESVGLPEGQMGTSEVNHFTIGAGRILFQSLVKINRAVDDNSFFENKAFIKACDHVKKNNSSLHIMGLLSDGGVHSHQEHIWSLLTLAKQQGIDPNKVFIHAFTDGRDTLPHNSLKYMQQLQDQIDEQGIGKIKSVVGRYFAMDRDHNWERIDKAFELLTQAKGAKFTSTTQAITQSYKNDLTDEFIEPAWIDGDEEGKIEDNDAVIFANFRNDRAKQLTERFIDKGPKNLCFVTMTEYSPNYLVEVAYPSEDTENILGDILSDNKIKQLRVTETEKFAHLTFFLNCKREDPYEGEDRIMLDSYSDIKTHDQKPQMRAFDIAKELTQEFESGHHQVIFSNICNGDMVGHTGNIPATIEACQVVDQCLKQIVDSALANDVTVLITADHGNCDEMIEEDTGEKLTSHSTNPVPLILISNKFKVLKDEHGSLIDIAPTILTMLEIDTPDDMTGESLV